MPRSALFAAVGVAILNVAAPAAGAAARFPIDTGIAGARADGAIRPAIVMFDLAIVRMRMLNTLTELIRDDRAIRAPHR